MPGQEAQVSIQPALWKGLQIQVRLAPVSADYLTSTPSPSIHATPSHNLPPAVAWPSAVSRVPCTTIVCCWLVGSQRFEQ